MRDSAYWNNLKGRAWTTVGWNVQSVNFSDGTVTFIQVVKPERKQRKKDKKQTEFFKRPLRFPKPKRSKLPSKTRIAKAQARLRNIERQGTASQSGHGSFAPKSAYEKRLFKPEAKPSKTSD
jgi:hypothetical protein